MDLRSGQSWWLKRETAPTLVAAPLDENIKCEVLVIGGGVTGSLLADALTKEGIDVVVLDKRRFGHGSTAASTALLMYELDVPLLELAGLYGIDDATQCYQASLRALQMLADTIQGLDDHSDFAWRKSLMFASRKSHAKSFADECAARRNAGIEVDLLSGDEIQSLFPFEAPCGLLSHQAAQVDPLRMTRALVRRSMARGARLFCETEVAEVTDCGKNATVITTADRIIKAQHVVFATGYETGAFLKRTVGSLHSSYVVCSAPTSSSMRWHDDWLLWESARPYVYLRTTADGRVIMGGEDVLFKNPAARDALLPRKTKALLKRYEKLFPGRSFDLECAWTGTFGESDDGLPSIGRVPEQPGCLFAVGYGGNGITFGMLAAEIIRDAILGRKHPDADLFSFNRTRR